VGLLEALAREKPAPIEAERRARAVLARLFDEAANGADDEARRPTPGDILTARLLSLATPQQQRHLADSLRDYRNDFRLLAAR
jgi:hypothetical protein